MDVFHAVREGDESEVLRLLSADRALLETENVVNNTPLAVAAMRGHLGLVKLVLRGAIIY